jgi:anti-sigma regulatory factor (Ser/Thr protein kinase)
VHEATANALEHAGAPDSIAVRASVEDGLVAAEVTDLGRWKWVVPDRDRGRGLAIIAELVSELEIRPDPGGTTVRMVYPLDGGDRGGHPNGAEAARLIPRSPQRAAPYRPDNV